MKKIELNKQTKAGPGNSCQLLQKKTNDPLHLINALDIPRKDCCFPDHDMAEVVDLKVYGTKAVPRGFL